MYDDVFSPADDLCRAAIFGRDAAREPVAELRSVGEHFLAAVAGIGVPVEAQIPQCRLREEVKE